MNAAALLWIGRNTRYGSCTAVKRKIGNKKKAKCKLHADQGERKTSGSRDHNNTVNRRTPELP